MKRQASKAFWQIVQSVDMMYRTANPSMKHPNSAQWWAIWIIGAFACVALVNTYGEEGILPAVVIANGLIIWRFLQRD